MRILVITVALCVALAGCAASKQEVAARLGDQFVGKNADAPVLQFGPPSSTFKMNSGETSYVWQLTAVTDISGDRGYAQAQSRFCKVSAIASPVGIVTQLNTEDSNAGAALVGVARWLWKHLRPAPRNETSDIVERPRKVDTKWNT